MLNSVLVLTLEELKIPPTNNSCTHQRLCWEPQQY